MKAFFKTINKDLLLEWLPFAVMATLLSGLVYAAVQQNFRNSANDPQVQVAEDLQVQLARGGDARILNTAQKIDMAVSLATFVIIFDDQGTPIVATAALDGKTPVPPKGVFDVARARGESRLTWEPKPGVRNAIVVRHFAGTASGFVLAGRSIREIEKRESWLQTMCLLGWLVTLIGTLVALIVKERLLD